MPPTRTASDPSSRAARRFTFGLALTALTSAASLALTSAQVALSREPAPSYARVDAVDDLVGSVGVMSSASLALAMLLLALWIHRAYTSAESLGVTGLPMRASRAAWATVIPALQLVYPFVALLGLRRSLDLALSRLPPPRASRRAEGHYRDNAAEAASSRAATPTVPLGAAWALWWSGNALGYIATWARGRAATRVDLRTALTIDLCAQLILLVAAVALWIVARRIQQRLSALRAGSVSDAY